MLPGNALPPSLPEPRCILCVVVLSIHSLCTLCVRSRLVRHFDEHGSKHASNAEVEQVTSGRLSLASDDFNVCCSSPSKSVCVLQLLDALTEESSPTKLDGDIMVAALRVCAKTGAWQSALRVWERLQNPAQQQQQSAQLRSAALQLVIQACKTGKNASKAAELAARTQAASPHVLM